MNETEQSVWGVIKQHWLTLGGGLFILFSIYTNDAQQSKQITELDARVQALEKVKADDATKWAVLNIQLSAIQSDLADIKTQLKKMN